MWYPKSINTNQALYKAIADAMEKDIHQGILNAGDKLPPQRKLADLIGVNLTTITRAYQEASNRNLIETRKGDGTYVRNIHAGTLNRITNAPLLELGLVNPGTSDLQPIMDALKKISSESAHLDIFGYVESQGLKRHRETAAKWFVQYGFRNVLSDQIVITSGAMNAINCVLSSLFQKDDIIATDSLTFAGFIHSAKMHGIHLIPIDSDHEGMCPEKLEQVCNTHKIKGIYLMPNMQNPTAKNMTDVRKRLLSEVIEKHNLLLIEDDIFAFTNLESNTALASLIPNQSIYICGISKLLYPGLRIAFVKVPDRFLNDFIDALVHTVWMASPISSEILNLLISQGDIHRVSASMRSTISKRQSLARMYLKPYVLSDNLESMYLWLQLPANWECDVFERFALRQGVNVFSASKFFVGNVKPPNAIRIALTTEQDEARFEEGLSRIANLLTSFPSTENAIM